MTTVRRPWIQWLCGLVLVATAFAVYSNVLSAPFVFDDESAIVQNPHIRSLSPLSRSLDAPPGTGASGRPLVALSLALNHALGGLEVRGYRGFNIAVHGLCALVLFGLLSRALRCTRTSLPATLLAFVVSLLWTVHPLCTDAVDLVITRNEQLMALFYLGTLYCALRAFEAGSPRTGRPGGWYGLAILACALGMACKENMLSAPLAVLLLDRWISKGSCARALRRRAPFYLGLAATWGLLALLVAHSDRGETVGVENPMGPLAYFLTQAEVIPSYLRLSVWPHPLILDYGDWFAFQAPRTWFPWAVGLLLSVAGAALLVQRRHPLGIPALVFFAVLAPTSSVVPITGEVAAEHRMYLPLTAVLICIVLPLAHVAGRTVVGRIVVTCAVSAVVLACAAGTIDRNRDYATVEGIWRDTLSKRPHNARAYCGLAAELIRQDRPREASDQLERSLRVRPSSAESHRLLGFLAAREGRSQAASEHYRAAARFLPSLPDHVFNVSMGALRSGDATFAAAGLAEVLGMRPNFLRARRELGWIRAASNLEKLRDGAAALALAQSLCESEASPQHLDLLAAAFAENGRFDEALTTIDRALQPSLTGESLPPGERHALRQRRELYRHHKPFRRASDGP